MTTPNPASETGVGLRNTPAEPTEDVKNFDEDALVDKISDGFAAAFGDDDDEIDSPDIDAADDPNDDEYHFTDEVDDEEEQDEEQDESAADDDELEIDDSNTRLANARTREAMSTAKGYSY